VNRLSVTLNGGGSEFFVCNGKLLHSNSIGNLHVSKNHGYYSTARGRRHDSARLDFVRNNGTPKETTAETVTKTPSPHVPVMTGDQWNEFIRLLTPDEQQAFMADVWKLINRYCRSIGGD